MKMEHTPMKNERRTRNEERRTNNEERRTNIYQQMTPEQKLQQALLLCHSARELKAAALRAKHPDWTDDQVQAEVREIFLYA